MERKAFRVVIDTCVFISALRSSRGASFHLLFKADREKFNQNVSIPLILEYEKISKAPKNSNCLSDEKIDSILDMLCQICIHREIFFLWRPFLKDPKNDFVLELAIESRSQFIITYNLPDFRGIDDFNISCITPKEFLKMIGELK